MDHLDALPVSCSFCPIASAAREPSNILVANDSIVSKILLRTLIIHNLTVKSSGKMNSVVLNHNQQLIFLNLS